MTAMKKYLCDISKYVVLSSFKTYWTYRAHLPIFILDHFVSLPYFL